MSDDPTRRQYALGILAFALLVFGESIANLIARHL